jgi:hypothetical protein
MLLILYCISLYRVPNTQQQLISFLGKEIMLMMIPCILVCTSGCVSVRLILTLKGLYVIKSHSSTTFNIQQFRASAQLLPEILRW